MQPDQRDISHTELFAMQKAHEGSQIGLLLGAVSALPGAALVWSADAAPGAPLFVAGLVFALAAYMHWLVTDAVFVFQVLAADANHPSEARLMQRGVYLSWATFAYGAASIACTALGFAGVYSSIPRIISIDHGFLIAGLLGAIAIIHCGHSMHLRNRAYS